MRSRILQDAGHYNGGSRRGADGGLLLFADAEHVPEGYLEIRGARVHNLKNIDLHLPHDQLVVVTGVSGSGKSSLVFDIIFAEGRRRYVESLSSYARQFLERMERPDVDEVRGIGPTVAIRQKNSTRNPRSTVATVTEIQDYLRLLFARVGQSYCVDCGTRVSSDGVDAVAEKMLAQEQGSRWYALFPLRAADIDFDTYCYEERYSHYPSQMQARLAQLRDRGFNRLLQDGRIFEFSTPESLLDIDFDSQCEVLVDRIAITPDSRERIAEAVEVGYAESGEIVFQSAADEETFHRFSAGFECSECAREYKRPEPEMFSFNTHLGACPKCAGFGSVLKYSNELIVSSPYLSLQAGAIRPWQRKFSGYKREMLAAAARQGIPTDIPYRDLEPEHRKIIEEGCEGFGGIRGFIEDLESEKWKPHIAALLSQWRRSVQCPECEGSRLRREVLYIRVGGEPIHRVLGLSLAGAREFFDGLEFEGSDADVASDLLTEIKNRIRFLNDVGLEYLTLDRAAASLSGGEAQRIQLASALGSRLVGVSYVLDEPSIGLHNRDTQRLIGVLKELRDLGNTVFVVEHDREMIEAADHLVDLGPAAGDRGGEVVFSGRIDQLNGNSPSLTARYLSGQAKVEIPARRAGSRSGRNLRFLGASKHNLKSIDVEIPVGVLTVITGVSGSGKSTLVHGIICEGMRYAIGQAPKRSPLRPPGIECEWVEGYDCFRDVMLVNQALADQTSRSVPATYVGVFDHIRKLFAATKRAIERGMSAADFSFNVQGGRCATCSGTGRQTVDMQFLADVDLPCEDCEGKRYQAETLDIQFQGKSICDVLEMTVDEAILFFSASPQIVRRLAVLAEVGLGYIRLGQPTTQLSGGEAQRMKVALRIAEKNVEDTLFLFDEPTTGLHFDDIRKLLRAFDRLIESGSTALVIEHNLDVIKCADWVIDLGPEGGAKGGRIVAQGTPEDIAKCSESHTGRYLRQALQ